MYKYCIFYAIQYKSHKCYENDIVLSTDLFDITFHKTVIDRDYEIVNEIDIESIESLDLPDCAKITGIFKLN